jgi:hypothetical protein
MKNQEKSSKDAPFRFHLSIQQMLFFVLTVAIVGGLLVTVLCQVFKEPVANAEMQVVHSVSPTHPPIDRLEFEKAMNNSCISFKAFNALAVEYTKLGYGTAPSYLQVCGKKAPVPEQANEGAGQEQGKLKAQG